MDIMDIAVAKALAGGGGSTYTVTLDFEDATFSLVFDKTASEVRSAIERGDSINIEFTQIASDTLGNPEGYFYMDVPTISNEKSGSGKMLVRIKSEITAEATAAFNYAKLSNKPSYVVFG